MSSVLEIRNLHLAMRSFDGEAHVLNGIELAVERRQVWGLVGETGWERDWAEAGRLAGFLTGARYFQPGP